MALYDDVVAANSLDHLTPEHTALFVIDMQRYFVHPEYPLSKLLQQIDPAGGTAYLDRVSHAVVPNIQRLQERFRSLEAFIVYTEFGSFRQDGRDMPGWARRHNALGHKAVGAAVYPPFNDPSCRVDDSLAPREGELVVQKSTSGPLNSTKLDQTLRVLGIDTVVVTGVATNVCVAQTVREFGDRDFEAIVVEDACATPQQDCHQPALSTIERTFGRVRSTDQVLEMLRRRHAT